MQFFFYLKGGSDWWRIGGERQGGRGADWMWINGQVVNQTQGAWSIVGENQGHTDTCMTFYEPTWLLDDGNCGHTGIFICEYDL